MYANLITYYKYNVQYKNIYEQIWNISCMKDI